MKLLFLLFLFLPNFAYEQRLPVAPYNVKLYCRNGRADTLKSMYPSLCPTSSTSCGYFEFPIPEKSFHKNSTVIYECVDSSILLKDYEDYEDKNNNLFYSYCDHIPKCQEIDFNDFNKQFLNYIIRTHSLVEGNFTSKKIKFCCSLSHSNLARLVKSKKQELSLSPSVTPVNCKSLKCSSGAVGCLFHQEFDVFKNSNQEKNQNFNEKLTDFTELHSEEYIDVKPVQLNWEEEDLVLEPKKPERKKRKIDFYDETEGSNKEETFNDGYQCVYMHLNDEIYRYCMMIYAQKTSSRCIEFDGHKVCCCFINPFESTCDPLLLAASVDPYSAPSTSTSRPISNSSNLNQNPSFHPTSSQEVQLSSEATFEDDNDTSTSTPTPKYFYMDQRTRCKIVTMTESRPHSKFKNKPRSKKRIICDDIRGSTDSSSSLTLNFSLIFILFSFILR